MGSREESSRVDLIRLIALSLSIRSFSPSLRTFLNSVRSLRPCSSGLGVSASHFCRKRREKAAAYLKIKPIQRRHGQRRIARCSKVGEGKSTELTVIKVIVEGEGRRET